MWSAGFGRKYWRRIRGTVDCAAVVWRFWLSYSGWARVFCLVALVPVFICVCAAPKRPVKIAPQRWRWSLAGYFLHLIFARRGISQIDTSWSTGVCWSIVEKLP